MGTAGKLANLFWEFTTKQSENGKTSLKILSKNYGFIHLFALSFLIAKLWVDLCLQKRYRLQVVLTLFDQLWGWKSGAASLVWQHFIYQLPSLKLFLHERVLQTVHLPGVLVKSLNEVCLLMLRVQEEDRPAQVAIGIQVHLCPCGTVRAEPIQTYLSQTIWYFLFFTWRFDNQLDISCLKERKENKLFCISCYLKRGTALGAQDRASQAQQILNPIPPVVPPPPKRNTPQKQVPSLTHLYCCKQTFLLTLFLLCHCLCLPCIPLLNLLRGRKNCTTVMHSKSRPSTTHYSAD